VIQSGVPHGAREGGWLPDCVFTGEKFEFGLAFFADTVGRITRFSREPADLAVARRLAGHAVLPGLVNAHSHALHRVRRGRPEPGTGTTGHEAQSTPGPNGVARLVTGEDVFDVARMAFLEMLLAGVTCVGEFHALHHQPDGTPWPDPGFLSREVMRAAHDVGIRVALLRVVQLRDGFRAGAGSAASRCRHASVDAFLREMELLRAAVEKESPADEAWLGVAPDSLGTVPLDAFKAVATYARAQRMRLHTHVSATVEENAACVAEYGRTPVALLAEHGVIDKRFAAVDAIHLTDDEMKLLGGARAGVCALSLIHISEPTRPY